MTRNISRSDPVWKTPEAYTAVAKEVDMLTRSRAINFSEVMEEEEARRMYPGSLFIPLNPILATKHAELPEEYHVLECRIVAGGD